MSVSVQLYTVRHAIDADLPATVQRLAQIGFTQVEPYNFVALADDLATAFAANGVTAPTGHAPLLSTDQDAIFAAARRLGITTVFEPFIPEEHWKDAESIRDTAARLNQASALGARHGIRVGYHNHWWELENSIDGTSGLEFFAGLLDPEVVLEVDTYWAATGGADPAALLERLGSRVVAIHIKDGPKTLDTKAQVPAGQGAVDVPGILAAATSMEVGVIEFDDYDGDIFAGLAESLAFVRATLADVARR
jgi:sugar phosphate isomerase/epimerase